MLMGFFKRSQEMTSAQILKKKLEARRGDLTRRRSYAGELFKDLQVLWRETLRAECSTRLTASVSSRLGCPHPWRCLSDSRAVERQRRSSPQAKVCLMAFSVMSPLPFVWVFASVRTCSLREPECAKNRRGKPLCGYRAKVKQRGG